MRVFKLLPALAMVALLSLGGCKSTKEILQVGEAAKSNPGPCPRAFALYDASRIVEFRDGGQRFANL